MIIPRDSRLTAGGERGKFIETIERQTFLPSFAAMEGGEEKKGRGGMVPITNELRRITEKFLFLRIFLESGNRYNPRYEPGGGGYEFVR